MRSPALARAAIMTATLLAGCGADAPTAASGERGASNATTPTSLVAPGISVSPTSLSFLLYVFRSLEPPSQLLNITSNGGKTLAWTASSNRSWLKITPKTGKAPSTITVSVDRATIPVGINGYRPSSLDGSITVSGAGASGTTQKIAVLLRLSYIR